MKKVLTPLAISLSLAARLSAAPVAAPPPPQILTAVGEVRVQLRSGSARMAGRVGMTLPEGAVVRTGSNGRVFIRFSATDLVRLAPDTELRVAKLPIGRITRNGTLLKLVAGKARAILNRTGQRRLPDFGIAAGNAVAAVKGTDFEVERQAATAIVSVRVDQGRVLVATARADDLVSLGLAFDEILHGAAGSPVVQGFRTSIGADGQVQPPRPAPVRTGLELVYATGRVTTVSGLGGGSAVDPGDELAPGTKLSVRGGEAVFAGNGAAVEAKSGASFTYDASVGGTPSGADEVRIAITVASDSGAPVIVEAAGQAVRVDPGFAGLTNSAAPQPVVVRASESRGAVASGQSAHPARLGESTVKRATSEETAGGDVTQTTGSVVTPPEESLLATTDILPALPTLSAETMIEAPVGAATHEEPPPPPDTTNLDVATVSPAAPQ